MFFKVWKCSPNGTLIAGIASQSCGFRRTIKSIDTVLFKHSRYGKDDLQSKCTILMKPFLAIVNHQRPFPKQRNRKYSKAGQVIKPVVTIPHPIEQIAIWNSDASFNVPNSTRVAYKKSSSSLLVHWKRLRPFTSKNFFTRKKRRPVQTDLQWMFYIAKSNRRFVQH